VWYRLPGLISVLALSIYVALMLAIFKLIPVTLTAAGIAGFILSIGMAVDANILIFERMKEELKKGKDIVDAIDDGFARAWLSIRDSNISSILSATILFWFGTSMVKGFALTLGIGVLVSMFSAITVSRTLLMALGTRGNSKVIRFFFGNGLN
jgi:protein-export membrane protein SecD